jgi:hypothetical protein
MKEQVEFAAVVVGGMASVLTIAAYVLTAVRSGIDKRKKTLAKDLNSQRLLLAA